MGMHVCGEGEAIIIIMLIAVPIVVHVDSTVVIQTELHRTCWRIPLRLGNMY